MRDHPMEITEALPTANKKCESLSANQKRNQRRAKHKSKVDQANASVTNNIPASKQNGFKYRTPIARKLRLYKNDCVERVSRHFLDKGLELAKQAEAWSEDILAMQVGMEYGELGRSALQTQAFVKPFNRFVERARGLQLAIMLNHHCPVDATNPTHSDQIHSLMRAIICKTGIVDLLGSKKNVNWFETCTKRYLNAPWMFDLPLGQLLKGMVVADVIWLKGLLRPLATNLLAKFLKWLLTKFIEAIVRGFFKSTPRADGKRKIFFYRKQVWKKILENGLARLRSRNYKLLTEENFQKLRTFIMSATYALRLLPKPKEGEVRPICVLKTNPKSSLVKRDRLFTKYILQDITAKFPCKSDLSGKSLYQSFTRLIQHFPETTPIYWVVADILDAFGSIKLNLLTNILREYDTEQTKTFLSALRKKLILKIVNFHCGGKMMHFLVHRGVLQGDSFSSLLSDIYYGHMTQHCFHQFLTPPPDKQEVFLRGADDFLFMTGERSRAIEFANLVIKGFPEYGCTFKHSKLRTNLQVSLVSPETGLAMREFGPDDQIFNYCGSIINMRDRSISPTTSSFDESNMVYAQTWPQLTNALFVNGRLVETTGQIIRRKFRSFCGQRLRIIYFNKTMPAEACCRNLATNVYIAVKRLIAMLDVLIISRGSQVEENWLWGVVMIGFRRFTSLRKHVQLSPSEIRWICVRTLIQLLKPNIFPSKFIAGIKSFFQKKIRLGISESRSASLEAIVKELPRRIKHLRASSKWP